VDVAPNLLALAEILALQGEEEVRTVSKLI